MTRYAEYDEKQVEYLLKTSSSVGLEEKEAELRLLDEKKKRPKRDGFYTLGGFFRTLFRRFSPFLFLVAFLFSFLSGDKKNALISLALYGAFVLILFLLWLFSSSVSKQMEEQGRLPVTVVRSGKKRKIRQEDIVCGDLLALEEGSILPFTAYLLSATPIAVWTQKDGKYKTLQKCGGVCFGEETPKNILKQGDVIRQGKCFAIVLDPTQEKLRQGHIKETLPSNLSGTAKMVFRICFTIAFCMFVLSFFVFADTGAILTAFSCVAALLAFSPLEWADFLGEAIFYLKNNRLLRQRNACIRSLEKAHRFAHTDCFIFPTSLLFSSESSFVHAFLNGTGSVTPLKKGSEELTFVSTCLCAIEKNSGGGQKSISDFFASYAQKTLPRVTAFSQLSFGEKKDFSVVSLFGAGQKPFSLIGGDAASLLKHTLYAKENGRTHLLDAQTKENILKKIVAYQEKGYRVVAYAQSSYVLRRNGEAVNSDAFCDMKLCGLLIIGSKVNKDASEFLEKIQKEGKKAVILYNGFDAKELLLSFSKKFAFEIVLGSDEAFETKVAAFAADKKRSFLLLCGADAVQKAGTARALGAVGYAVAAFGEQFEEHRMLCAAQTAVTAVLGQDNRASEVVYDSAEVHTEKTLHGLLYAQSIAKDMTGAFTLLTLYLSVSLLLRTTIAFFGAFFSVFLLSPLLLCVFGVAVDLTVVFCLAFMHFSKGANGEEGKLLSHIFAWITAAFFSALALGSIAVYGMKNPSVFPFSVELLVSVSLLLLLNMTLLSFSRVKLSAASLAFPFYTVLLAGLLVLVGGSQVFVGASALFALVSWVLLPIIVFAIAERLFQLFFKNHIKIKEIYYE
ncbi:MAG: cation-transporting P-type ATPase [Clostridia bacterium]|nr:cation-transporting P-type ATPase [Clostridia bacterium]